jgi:N-methylhydantoinase A
MAMASYSIGIDIGGSFTDLVAVDRETGRQINVKVPSTPPRFIDGVMNALHRAGLAPAEVDILKHGSTIATNAIIERRGARTALVTTMGMRDVLAAGRANRPDLFNSNWDPAPPLVPRRNVLTVRERVDYEGTVLTPLSEEDVRGAAAKMRKRGIESVAVCFLNSFMNPEHERRTKAVLAEALGPEVFICCSSDILPEIREFERTSTTTANAFLAPVVGRYIDELLARVRGWGYERDVLVTHSGGGVMSCDAARNLPARICQSGPAGGVIGGAFIGKLAGFENVITLDIGGTSTDLSLVDRGQPLIRNEWRVEWNIPIMFPAIDLVAIGAGGGSIAWIDAGGALRNGPQSAGADPGPACYGKGNTRPTNTDAHLVLGRLNPLTFLGGEMSIHPDLARAAVRQIADHYGMSLEQAAEGILRVANANMMNATHLISVQRGYDPRDFALVAFGGAGPLHAVDLARDLGIPTVVVPPHPGLTSARGVLQVDVRHDFLLPVLRQRKDLDPARLGAIYDELVARAGAALEREGIPPEARDLQLAADVRYYGQSPYLTMPLAGPVRTAGELDAVVRAYNDRYLREFGYTMPPEVAEVEVVNARVTAVGATPQAAPTRAGGDGRPASAAIAAGRRVHFGEAGFVATPVYERGKLVPGHRLAGPAVIEQMDSTTIVPPGAEGRVDEYLNLIVTVGRS